MQLHALSADELVFLTTTPADGKESSGANWLEHRLAATLAARLRLPVSLEPEPADAQTPGSIAAPVWRPDAALATLWLTRRLGGTRPAGSAPFVPRSLLETLDATLAETCVGQPAPQPGTAFAWEVITPLGAGRLALQLPCEAMQLTRWAQGMIRHG